MFDKPRRALLMVSLAALLPLGAARAADGITWKKEEKQVTATINWCTFSKQADCGEPSTDAAAPPRIDVDSMVSVKVTHFNFIHYNVEFTVDEKQVESYAYLSGLWDQILRFTPSAALPAGIAADATWWKRVREIGQQLQIVQKGYAGAPYLTATQVAELTTRRRYFLDSATELNQMRTDAFGAANTVEELQKFDIVDKDHTALITAINAFASLAQRSIDGQVKSIGKKSAGTYVTITVTPTALPAAEAPPGRAASLEYFSESAFPLMFHVGLTHNQLRDVKFETVRALDGRDLFTKVRDEKGTETFSAYLSYPLGDTIDKARFFLTLGTDLKDLGDNLYAGLSARVASRWFISAGGVYGREKEGQGATPDDGQSSAAPPRTLYEIVKEERKWGAFASVSVKLY